MARQLLLSITKKDFRITYFSGTGAGGQHRNKHMNCVRLTHIDSGAATTGQSSKSRDINLKEAFKKIQVEPKFKMYVNIKIMEALNKETLIDKVKKSMSPKNLKIEGKNEKGQWDEAAVVGS